MIDGTIARKLGSDTNMIIFTEWNNVETLSVNFVWNCFWNQSRFCNCKKSC